MRFTKLSITFHLWKGVPNFWIMSKAFDTVWQEGLICKLKTKGDSDNLLTLFISIPDKRYQKHLT